MLDLAALSHPDLDAALLAAALQHPHLLDDLERVRPEQFSRAEHGALLTLARKMRADGTYVDEVSVFDALNQCPETNAKAFLPTVTALFSRETSPARFHVHLRAFRERCAREEIHRAVSDTERQIAEGVASTEVLASLQSAIIQIENAPVHSVQSLAELAREEVEFCDRKLAGEPDNALSTTITDLDAMINGGLRPGNLMIIAARPAMGKTCLGMQIMLAATLKNVPTLFFSLEMSQEELVRRALAHSFNVHVAHALQGVALGPIRQRVADAASALSDTRGFIDDRTDHNISSMRSVARRINAKTKLGLVVIDYLQLADGMDRRASREQQIAEISRGCKAMAKELSLPIVVLSQLNRSSDREKRRPRLSDLRESGAIEQDADQVVFLYKEASDSGATHAGGEMEIILAKNRHGRQGTVKVEFLPPRSKFQEWSGPTDGDW